MLIRLDGADGTLKALRKMEPETAREVGRDISKIGKNLAAAFRLAAPELPPVSGWVATSGARGSRGGAGWPGWVQPQASYMRRDMSVRVLLSSNPPAIAAMAESLGSGGNWKTRQGLNLVAMTNNRFGRTVKSGKKEGKAISEQYPQINQDLEDAVNRAVDAVNRLMP